MWGNYPNVIGFERDEKCDRLISMKNIMERPNIYLIKHPEIQKTESEKQKIIAVKMTENILKLVKDINSQM